MDRKKVDACFRKLVCDIYEMLLKGIRIARQPLLTLSRDCQ